jgi:hypothetical protein
VNGRESLIRQRYEADGWKIMHSGAPDFIAIRNEGAHIRVIAIEVKARGSELSLQQQEYREALEAVGIEYRVEVADSPPVPRRDTGFVGEGPVVVNVKARVRNQGRTTTATIPSEVVKFLSLQKRDFLAITVDKVRKPEGGEHV